MTEYPTQDAYRASLEVRYASGVLPPEAYSNRAERNRVVDELVWTIDNDFQNYVESLYASGALFDTITDLVILGAASASTVAGGEGAKTILSAVAAGVTGARSTINKNFFAEQSKVALISKMKEMRARTLLRIEEGKRTPISVYPMSQAMVDLQAYYFAGNILSALQDITREAGEGLTQQQEALRLIRRQADDAQ
jgi:hypothetical protein